MFVIATLCLIDSPAVCRTVNLALLDDRALTPHQCMVAAQTELAKWCEAHPDYRITKFRCGPKPETDL